MRKISSILFIFFLFISTTFSQNIVDSLQFIQSDIPANNFKTNFEKQLNTYRLLSSFRYNNTFGKFNLNLKENYNSSYFRSAISSLRDEHFFNLSGIYNITNKINTGLLVTNNILSDSRHIEINQASQSSVAFFTQYTPEEKITISPFGGIITNDQTGEKDIGALYGIEGFVDNVLLSDNTLKSQIKIRNEDISPRKNSIRYYNFILTNNISSDLGNIINASYSQNRKDFYFAADSITNTDFNVPYNIQSRIESDYFLQDRFTSNEFLDFINLDISGRFLWRTIDRDTRYKSLRVNSNSVFDTKIDELKVEFESLASFNTEFFSGSLRIAYSERDEKHTTKNFEGTSSILFQERSEIESRKNNKSSRATAAFIGNFNLSESDKISVSFYQNKLRYDTPSTDNFDDRDEMLSIARIQYSKILTPFLEVFINSDVTINRTAYIFSEKSSNNNINRILRLNTGGNYRGKNFVSLNSFEVSANYTVYDFEDINPNYKSFSFRQFTARDSSSLLLNSRLSVSTYGYVKLSEQGDFKWASFTTNPTRYLQEIYSESKFTVKYDPIWLSLGARIFSLNTYTYKVAEKFRDSKFLSVAPLTEIVIVMNDSLYVRLYGWYEFISLNDIDRKEETNLSLQVNWNF